MNPTAKSLYRFIITSLKLNPGLLPIVYKDFLQYNENHPENRISFSRAIVRRLAIEFCYSRNPDWTPETEELVTEEVICLVESQLTEHFITGISF